MRLRWDTSEGGVPVEKEVEISIWDIFNYLDLFKSFDQVYSRIRVFMHVFMYSLTPLLLQGGRDPVVAYDNWQETRTVEELERIKSVDPFFLLFVERIKSVDPLLKEQKF